jgi:predicted Rossmann-fold nucleotide-binding protein
MNPAQRSKCVIAVFGGSKEPAVGDLAETIGRAVASEGQFLLTGGAKPSGRPGAPVKERALHGARNSPWIGVDRRESGGTECSINRQTGGLVITTDLGHKRDYLEARMCDAAICLAGGEGTKAEAVSALVLGRPVAFVGEAWKELYEKLFAAPPERDLGYQDQVARDVLKKLFDGSGGRGTNHSLDSLITLEALQDGLNRVHTMTLFPSRPDPTEVVRWALQHIASPPSYSCLPELDPDQESVNECYREWRARRIAPEDS